MRKAYLALLFTVSVGVASPDCRRWVAPKIHHSAATLAKWKTWNRTHPEWAKTHPHGNPKSVQETLSMVDWCKEQEVVVPEFADLIPDLPAVDTPEFAEQPIPEPSKLKDLETADTDKQDSLGWRGGNLVPLFLGSGPLPAPVPETPTLLMVATGLGLMLVRKMDKI